MIKTLKIQVQVEVFNRFESLEQESDAKDQGNKNSLKDKIAKALPNFVDGVGNIQTLIHLLNEITPNSYAIKILNNDQVRIQSGSSLHYAIRVNNLKERNIEFHTFKPKQERYFKVVLKNMHYSTDINEIKDKINKKGHLKNISSVLFER